MFQNKIHNSIGKHLVRGNHDDLAERLTWAGPIVDVRRVFVQDPGMPQPQALWCSHYAHATRPRAWNGDLHIYGHSHGSIPATRTSLDVGVDCWDWHPVTLGGSWRGWRKPLRPTCLVEAIEPCRGMPQLGMAESRRAPTIVRTSTGPRP